MRLWRLVTTPAAPAPSLLGGLRSTRSLSPWSGSPTPCSCSAAAVPGSTRSTAVVTRNVTEATISVPAAWTAQAATTAHQLPVESEMITPDHEQRDERNGDQQPVRTDERAQPAPLLLRDAMGFARLVGGHFDVIGAERLLQLGGEEAVRLRCQIRVVDPDVLADKLASLAHGTGLHRSGR